MRRLYRSVYATNRPDLSSRIADWISSKELKEQVADARPLARGLAAGAVRLIAPLIIACTTSMNLRSKETWSASRSYGRPRKALQSTAGTGQISKLIKPIWPHVVLAQSQDPRVPRCHLAKITRAVVLKSSLLSFSYRNFLSSNFLCTLSQAAGQL